MTDREITKDQPDTHLSSSVIKTALILVLGAMAPMLDTTMTNIGINTILKDLGSTVNTMQWITTAYVLALGLTVPLAGWLINRMSGKRLMELSLLFFLIGSIISGMATDVPALLIGRIVQGAAAGVIITSLTTLMVKATEGHALGKLMAIVGLPIVFAPILGPTVGGALIKFLNWHWLFYINIPVIVIALLFTFFGLPTFEPTKSNRSFDFIGFALLTGLFAGIVIGVTNYSTDNVFGKMDVLLPVFLSIDCLVLYIIYGFKRPAKALIPLSLFDSSYFSASAALLFLSGLMVNGVMFVLPLYLQNIRHLSVIWSGIYLIALGAGMLVTRTQVGSLTDKHGAKWITIISLMFAVLTTLPFAFFTDKTANWIVIAMLFLMGLSRSGITIPVMTDTYTGMDQKLVAEATVATRMAQNIGGSVATAVLATIIQSYVGSNVATTAMMNNAYSHAFIWTAVGTIIGLIPALFLSARSGKEAA
ncbi:MAG: DHA2 family efflux MFS transporter permease subunit [Sporolactobacillus sp.]